MADLTVVSKINTMPPIWLNLSLSLATHPHPSSHSIPALECSRNKAPACVCVCVRVCVRERAYGGMHRVAMVTDICLTEKRFSPPPWDLGY